MVARCKSLTLMQSIVFIEKKPFAPYYLLTCWDRVIRAVVSCLHVVNIHRGAEGPAACESSLSVSPTNSMLPHSKSMTSEDSTRVQEEAKYTGRENYDWPLNLRWGAGQHPRYDTFWYGMAVDSWAIENDETVVVEIEETISSWSLAVSVYFMVSSYQRGAGKSHVEGFILDDKVSRF